MRTGFSLRLIVTSLATTLLTLLALPASAQPMADHVPHDATVYIGWRGADRTADYDGSRLQQMLEQTELIDRIARTFSNDLQQPTPIQGPDGQRLTGEQIMRHVYQALWHRPWAGYIGRFEVPDDSDRPPFSQAGLVLQRGENDATLRALFQAAIEDYDDPEASRPQLIENDDRLILRLGDAPSDATIADNQRFQRTRRRLTQTNPAARLYTGWVDVQSVLTFAGRMCQVEDAPLDRQTWEAVSQSLGLNGLKQLVTTGGFAERDFHMQTYLRAPGERRGVLSLLEGEPVRKDTLQMVPEQATWLRAFHFDLEQVMALTRRVADDIGQQPRRALDGWLDTVSRTVGVDLETDVLQALGDQWALYSEPGFSGYMGMSLGLVQQVRDPDRLNTSLTALKEFANQRLHENEAPFQITTIDLGRIKVNSFGTPMVSPSWAVRDGHLFVGLSSQAITRMHRQVTDAGTSILDNDAFTQMRARLNGDQSSSLMYADIPATAETYYQNYAQYLGMASGPAQRQANIDLTQFLPPFNALSPHLARAGKITFTDENGFHTHYIVPFPGAEVFSPEAAMSQMNAAGPVAGMMLPALFEARKTARRVEAESKLRSISQSVVIYANDHDQQFPPDLHALVEGNYLAAEVLLHPASDTTMLDDFSGLSADQQRQWIRENADFVYVASDEEDNLAQDKIMAFEKPRYASDEGIAIAFKDAHVERIPRRELNQRLREQTDRNLQDWLASSTTED